MTDEGMTNAQRAALERFAEERRAREARERRARRDAEYAEYAARGDLERNNRATGGPRNRAFGG